MVARVWRREALTTKGECRPGWGVQELVWLSGFSRVRLFVNCGPPGSSVRGISPRQEYWSGLPFPSPGALLTQGLNPHLLNRRWILSHLSHWRME